MLNVIDCSIICDGIISIMAYRYQGFLSDSTQSYHGVRAIKGLIENYPIPCFHR